MHDSQRLFRRLLGDGIDKLIEDAFGYYAEKLAHLCVRNRVAAVGDGLLQQRKPVAQAAFRRARQYRHRARLNPQIFGLGYALKFSGNFLEAERAKLKQLRP